MTTLRTRFVLLVAGGVAAGLLQTAAPASAYCVEVADGCYNPCSIASDAYSKATGRPGFNCPK